MKIKRLLVAFLVFASGCMADQKSRLPLVVLQNQGMVIKEWLLIGPFGSSSYESAIATDFIEKLGRSETTIQFPLPSGIESLADAEGVKILHASSDPRINFAKLFTGLGRLAGGTEKAVYAACEIETADARIGWLHFGSDDGAKIWLNGELVFAFMERREFRLFGDAIRLPLKRGKNQLLIKVANADSGWGMSAQLEPDMSAAAGAVVAANDRFFERAFLRQGEPLILSLQGVPQDMVFRAMIENCADRGETPVEFAPGQPTDVSMLEPGLYRVKFSHGGRTPAPLFYIGSFDELYFEAQAKVSALPAHLDDHTRINLQALVRRLEIATKPLDLKPGTARNVVRWNEQEREQRALYAANALDQMLAWLAKDEEAFRDRAGLHLRGFRSTLDDQVMHYRLFVPTSYERGKSKLPLVVVMPTAFSGQRPFLESAFVADHVSAERWAAIAERLGIGLLWSGYRVCPYGNPIDFAHLDETLAAVGKDYDLDESRLSIYGLCSAGMTSAMEVLRNPERYAGIALWNAVIHRRKGRFDDAGRYDEFPAYREWLRATDPLAGLAALRGLPCYIVHDGTDPEHGPLSDSVELVNLSRAHGNAPRFIRDNTPSADRFEIQEKILAWLAAQQRVNPGTQMDQIAKPSGPIGTALCSAFVVVRGTQGSAAERAAATRWCGNFQDAWRRTSFVPCQVVDDVDYDLNRDGENLVLVGNAETNSIWRHFSDAMEVDLQRGQARIGEKQWKGEGLAVQTWVPYPGRPAHRIVLIGAADLEHTAVGTMELTLDGWFDFAVWKTEQDHPKLIEAGRNDAR